MQIITNIVLTILTGVLAWATINLAKYTKELARHTNELVRVENEREKHTRQEKRRERLKELIELVENVLKIVPHEFGAFLERGQGPEPAASLLKNLELFTIYIDDSGTVQYLKEILPMVQIAARGGSIGGNRSKTETDLSRLQERLYGLHLHKWRTELESTQPT